MNFLKLALVLVLAGIFIFACNNRNATTNNTAVVMSNRSVITSNSPIVTYNTSTDNTAGDELASAKKIYSEKCVNCHKEDGKGGISMIDNVKIKAPDFTNERHKNDLDSEYIETIEGGAKEDGMPAYKGKISDDDIKNLVKYIRRNFQGKQ